ncbi:hypothetical protein QOZ80_1AG0008430 [Eleusine coracana subsp. coracana]|nr:hypothetical protein QOZ80_1AG0008430 [Eleusine coracana subsp. coracana]
MEVTSYAIPFSNYLDTFDLSSNRLQGQIPMPSSSARILDYSNNSFSSILANFTLYLSYTEYLSLSKNNLSGYLPNSICDSYIRVLDISYNNFKGQPPPCLIDNGYMIILNLRENQFEGELPSNISSGCSLQTIDLHANKIEGQLPRALYNCTALELLDLGRNQITDTFPSWLGTLLNLCVLVLRSNQFHGSIGYLKDGKFGENFSTLQILDLASNNFSGNLHPQWFENLMSMEKYNNTGQIMGHQNVSIAGFYQDTVTISYKGSFIKFGRILTTLTTIDLSDNALEGSIPASIGKLVSLRALNMSHNAFTGKIPPQFGDMTAVESLDVFSNMLSGEIPQELTNLTFLSILNLSDNQLEGKIPQSYQFTTFQSGSFGGNNELCGLPLPKQCDAPNTPNDIHMKNSSDSVDIVLFAFVGVGFGMGFATSILVKLDWIKRWFCNVNSTNMT